MVLLKDQGILYYSVPAGVLVLPLRCGIWLLCVQIPLVWDSAGTIRGFCSLMAYCAAPLRSTDAMRDVRHGAGAG